MKKPFIDRDEKTVSAVINYMKNNIVMQTDFYLEIIISLKLKFCVFSSECCK